MAALAVVNFRIESLSSTSAKIGSSSGQVEVIGGESAHLYMRIQSSAPLLTMDAAVLVHLTTCIYDVEAIK